MRRSLCAALLLAWACSALAAPAQEIAALLQTADVVLLGEKHHRPESTELLTEIVKTHPDCLTVALEISSDQQTALDAAIAGTAPPDTVKIHPIIDHPAYRSMLAELAGLARSGRCLSVVAIDAPQEQQTNRDAWMLGKLAAAKRPVLALLGNLHALKKIYWKDGRDAPFLAERLARAGVRVASVLQDWPGKCEARAGAIFSMQAAQAKAVVDSIIGITSAHPVQQPEQVADRVVVWGCSAI